MRQIKFNAWSKSRKKMYYDVQEWDDASDELCGFGFCGLLDDKDIELIQFTGLHDKNGKEIWEGDIIRTPAGICPIDSFRGCFFGAWPTGGRFTLWDITSHNGKTELIEVLGNIYENPELLESK